MYTKRVAPESGLRNTQVSFKRTSFKNNLIYAGFLWKLQPPRFGSQDMRTQSMLTEEWEKAVAGFCGSHESKSYKPELFSAENFSPFPSLTIHGLTLQDHLNFSDSKTSVKSLIHASHSPCLKTEMSNTKRGVALKCFQVLDFLAADKAGWRTNASMFVACYCQDVWANSLFSVISLLLMSVFQKSFPTITAVLGPEILAWFGFFWLRKKMSVLDQVCRRLYEVVRWCRMCEFAFLVVILNVLGGESIGEPWGPSPMTDFFTTVRSGSVQPCVGFKRLCQGTVCFFKAPRKIFQLKISFRNHSGPLFWSWSTLRIICEWICDAEKIKYFSLFCQILRQNDMLWASCWRRSQEVLGGTFVHNSRISVWSAAQQIRVSPGNHPSGDLHEGTTRQLRIPQVCFCCHM